jgi:short-subunit dehydrogenase
MGCFLGVTDQQARASKRSPHVHEVGAARVDQELFPQRNHDAGSRDIYVLATVSGTYARVRDPRSILITGASSGIGAALARAYAAPRTRLALCGRNAARLAAVANFCRERGAEVIEARLDITEAAAVAAWVVDVDRASPLELVIANAGVQGGLWRDGAGETLDELHRVMEVNFGGVSNTVYPVLPAMRRRRRGQVALISSLAALRGLPYSPGYCASKAAVRIYGEALRSWLAPEGIGVSVVLPGFVETRLSDTVSGPKPLILPPERAAGIIRRGLAKGRRQIAFPYPLYLGVQLMRALPAGLVDPILRRVAVDIGPYA